MSIMIVFKRLPGSGRLRELLRQGLEPGPLALTFALGATVGVVPFPWGASLLCVLLATRLGLNQAAIQLANYAVWPLQILLFVLFLKLGRLLFGSGGTPVEVAALVDELQQDPLQGLALFSGEVGRALGAWLLLAPLLVVVLRRFLLWLFTLRRSAV